MTFDHRERLTVREERRRTSRYLAAARSDWRFSEKRELVLKSLEVA